MHYMLNRYRERAGIPRRLGRAYGMHSLRHTCATHLQQAQVPLETIASVLGHQSLASTRVYTQVDVPALRQVALDPEEVNNGR
jgi:site-specific recombinase XerD